MSFVQRDDMVQALSPSASNPSFRGSNCQGDWMLVRFGFRPVAFRNVMTVASNFASRSRSFRKSLAQLLHDPLRTRMSSDVEMQDPVAPVLDDKEAVQQLERQRRHGEDIEGDDDLPVILQKSQPPFTRVASALNSTQIPGNRPLRGNEPEIQQLAVNPGGLPSPDSPPPIVGSAPGSPR